MGSERLCVVLAGGAGQRIGGRKPQRLFGDRSLGALALSLAAGFADHVALAVRDPAQSEGLGPAELLFDPPGIEGPLAGVLSALTHGARMGVAQVLTIPCDTPRLPDDLYTRLAAALEQSPDALAARASDGAHDHPACALWRVEALGPVQRYAHTGRRSLHGALSELNAATVEWSEPDMDWFLNINTRDQLKGTAPPITD